MDEKPGRQFQFSLRFMLLIIAGLAVADRVGHMLGLRGLLVVLKWLSLTTVFGIGLSPMIAAVVILTIEMFKRPPTNSRHDIR